MAKASLDVVQGLVVDAHPESAIFVALPAVCEARLFVGAQRSSSMPFCVGLRIECSLLGIACVEFLRELPGVARHEQSVVLTFLRELFLYAPLLVVVHLQESRALVDMRYHALLAFDAFSSLSGGGAAGGANSRAVSIAGVRRCR